LGELLAMLLMASDTVFIAISGQGVSYLIVWQVLHE
jgi:hypothetical protein